MIGGLRWASPELLPGQSCCALAHSSSDQRASPSLCCPGTQSRAGSPSTGSWEHTKHRASITRSARGPTWHGRDGSCSHQRCPEPQCWLHHGQAQLCSLSGQHSQPRANRNWDWECWLTGLWHDLAIKKHKMLLLVWVFFFPSYVMDNGKPICVQDLENILPFGQGWICLYSIPLALWFWEP